MGRKGSIQDGMKGNKYQLEVTGLPLEKKGKKEGVRKGETGRSKEGGWGKGY